MSKVKRNSAERLPYGTRLKLTLLKNFVWLIVVGTFLFFGILMPRSFLTLKNLSFMVYISSMLGFIALAEAVCLISGNFDISVEAIAGFAPVLTAKIVAEWVPGVPWYLAMMLVLLIGMTCGIFNGFFVGKKNINPFLQTLATFIILKGGTLVVSLRTIFGLPELYLKPGGGEIFGIPMAIFIFFAAVLVLYILMRHTCLGMRVYATGGDPISTSMSGVRVDNIILYVYALSGLLCGIAGLLYTGFLGAATPDIARDTLFTAFAAAVIGGVSIKGGRGSLIGVIGGVLLLGIIDAGLIMLYVPPCERRVVYGILVFVAILVNDLLEKLSDKILMHGK